MRVVLCLLFGMVASTRGRGGREKKGRRWSNADQAYQLPWKSYAERQAAYRHVKTAADPRAALEEERNRSQGIRIQVMGPQPTVSRIKSGRVSRIKSGRVGDIPGDQLHIVFSTSCSHYQALEPPLSLSAHLSLIVR